VTKKGFVGFWFLGWIVFGLDCGGGVVDLELEHESLSLLIMFQELCDVLGVKDYNHVGVV
jgi:hypothetical protein